MKRLVVIIIGAVIAGKIFAAAVVRFAENSNLTSKTLVHRLLLDRINSDDQMKVSDIPNNLAISKPKPRPIFQSKPPQVAAAKLTVVTPLKKAPKVAKAEEKAIEDKAKEDERRKKRRKSLEEKTNAVATTSGTTPPSAEPYVPPVSDNPYPTYYSYQAPIPQASPQALAPPPIIPLVSGGGVGNISNKNSTSSWTNILVNNPTASLMATFENLYKTHQIPETEYYSVLDAMKASSNSEARNYAVQAAALYQNIFSFKILADESQTENNPQIKASALSDIQAYAVAADASILQQALASGDPYEILEAKTLLGSAAVVAAANSNAIRN